MSHSTPNLSDKTLPKRYIELQMNIAKMLLEEYSDLVMHRCNLWGYEYTKVVSVLKRITCGEVDNNKKTIDDICTKVLNGLTAYLLGIVEKTKTNISPPVSDNFLYGNVALKNYDLAYELHVFYRIGINSEEKLDPSDLIDLDMKRQVVNMRKYYVARPQNEIVVIKNNLVFEEWFDLQSYRGLLPKRRANNNSDMQSLNIDVIESISTGEFIVPVPKYNSLKLSSIEHELYYLPLIKQLYGTWVGGNIIKKNVIEHKSLPISRSWKAKPVALLNSFLRFVSIVIIVDLGLMIDVVLSVA